MHFLRPEWFLALIPLFLLLVFIKKNQGASSSWDQYIAPHLATVLLGSTQRKPSHSVLYLTFAWLVAILALSGPALEKTSLPVYESTQGRVLVMDMSLSMYANDLSPNRLTQAKYRATDLIEVLAEGETGLVAYAGDAFTISPLTRDKATLLNLLPTLTPSIMPVKGSNIEAALEHAKSLLSQGGHISGDIVLFTDGISSSQLNQAKSVLKSTPYRLGILAFGSEQGAPIQLPDGQLLRDNGNQVVVAKTDYGLLQSLATSANGSVIPIRADGQDVTQLVQWLASTKDSKESDLEGEVWQDLGGYVALLLLLPVLLSFRHGIVGAVAFIAIIQPAQPVYANSWDNLWQTQNQQASSAYQAQQYEAAAEQFEQAQWQASARYKAGQFDEALAGFEQDSSATGLYNQGNALMQLGQYDEAEKRYQQALEQAPQMDAAKQNLDLAKELQQQQEQQQKNSQGDDQQNSDEQQNNEQQQSDGSESNDKQSQDGSSPPEDDNGQQNKESSDDANSEDDSGKDPVEESAEPQENDNQGAAQNADQNLDDKQRNDNDAAMEADNSRDDSKEESQQGQQAKAQQSATETEDLESDAIENEQQGSMVPATPSDEPLPPEMERALKAIADDPQVLLRNKMQLEYQKRRRQGINTKENQQW
ncbi:VWA domain-containing protein [Shewanella sp. KX20019]|uniref:VWA domain-containing protein n=1 Tax=Shewanella sp. KX20019 TaxID=2803864 RepID=UPI001928DA05|nr:VWA domain-containing protein [Shewanella sp. KX20019]QQX78774.1 VWA domain-containing protein [Shewanella sp. KX20019]